MSFKTPVVFIIYNRPELTAKIFDIIGKIQPKNLYVIADGPKSIEDEFKCENARKVTENINWDCNVSTIYSDINLGCKHRISSGLDWVFSNVEEAIILEDDCLPDLSFFRFCSELLARYRNEERIVSISGNNFQFSKNHPKHSYYFSKYTHIWGWATWKRVWNQYDVSIAKWKKLRETNWLREISHSDDEIEYWTTVFDDLYKGLTNTWDFQLQFLSYVNNGVSIIPSVNLVKNIGFGNDSTHTKSSNPNVNYLNQNEMKFPLKHPDLLTADTEADSYSFGYVYRGKEYIDGLDKIKPKIKRGLNKIVSLKT